MIFRIKKRQQGFSWNDNSIYQTISYYLFGFILLYRSMEQLTVPASLALSSEKV